MVMGVWWWLEVVGCVEVVVVSVSVMVVVVNCQHTTHAHELYAIQFGCSTK